MTASRTESPRPFVSVAICTFNRATLLESTLASLTGLNIPASLRWELVVVDNGSTDDTQSACASFLDRLPMRIVLERQPGLSRARNRALAEVDGDWVLFTDDDVRVGADWLWEFVAAVQRHPGAAAAGGPIEPWFPVSPPKDLLEAFPMLTKGFCGVDYRLLEGPLPPDLPIFGANMAFRLTSVSGLEFDPRFGYTPTSLRGGEEGQFLLRVRGRGGEVIWCPAMRLEHYVDPSRMTLKYLVARAVGCGEEYIRSHGVPAGSVLFGVPRWLIRKMIEAYGRYVAARFLAPRAEALKWLRQYSEYRGMVRECYTAGRTVRHSSGPLKA